MKKGIKAGKPGRKGLVILALTMTALNLGLLLTRVGMAAIDDGIVGRYQIACVGSNTCFIIHTTNGDIVKIIDKDQLKHNWPRPD